MARRETAKEAIQRFEKLRVLQEHYAGEDGGRRFLRDVIEGLMGFVCTDLQVDIWDYIAYGPQYGMVQAQRGQAKTTITAIYAVWRLIHSPHIRVLIISSGGPMAKQISGWIIQIINGMDVLECMRPDRGCGDRTSIEAYDVHYSLKGPEKSPSVACLGILANTQGFRADLLIADDVESHKNSYTETARALLLTLTFDFASLCSTGQIIYLGTPQSVDSIYNTLPSRGYSIRIWPGRYPTNEEEPKYGPHLAPMILAAMEANPNLRKGGGPTGKRGIPTDPVLINETLLSFKETDQGAAYFQLQHMLDTALTDAARFPLKLSKLVFCHIADDKAAFEYTRMADPRFMIPPPAGQQLADPMYSVAHIGTALAPFEGTHMYVDPAGGGQNGDETAWAVTRFLAGWVFLVAVGGMPGGSDTEHFSVATGIVKRWRPNLIHVEENMGKGMWAKMWRPMLMAEGVATQVDDVWESGQKELRIIDTLEPLIGRGKLVVCQDLIEDDWAAVQKYGPAKAQSFSFLNQLSKITRDKHCLTHDDKLDAVAGSCRHWKEILDQDETRARELAERAATLKLFADPLANGGNFGSPYQQREPNALDTLLRR